VEARAAWWAEKASRMPADGIVMAKEAFRLVEQLQGYQGEEVLSYLFHAYGTNLQFDDGDFNFVKVRSEHGTKRAFELRDTHFEVPEP
jgi:enoyl-CoA hydratase